MRCVGIKWRRRVIAIARLMNALRVLIQQDSLPLCVVDLSLEITKVTYALTGENVAIDR